jgi:kynurenine formamidase
MAGTGSGTEGDDNTLSRAEFEELFAELTDWAQAQAVPPGTFGAGPATAAIAAARLVREGRVVPMAWPIDTTAGPDNPKPALFYMSELSGPPGLEPLVNTDFIGFDYHGKSVTHLDALCHMGFHGLLYGGVPAREAVTARGSTQGDVAALGAFFRPGVLLDIPASKGLSWLEPGTSVHVPDLRDAAGWAGVKIEKGWALFVRTGHGARRAALGPWDPSNLSAGLHPLAMRQVAAWDVALLGSDGDSDVRPSPVPGVHSPVHALALVARGMPLLDNMALEELSNSCRELGRYTFLCVVSPLNVPGGTGSPVTPLAVF